MNIAKTVKAAIEAGMETTWSVKLANETGIDSFSIDTYKESHPEHADMFMTDDCIEYGVSEALAIRGVR